VKNDVIASDGFAQKIFLKVTAFPENVVIHKLFARTTNEIDI